MRATAYLAGPDVFLPDATIIGKRKQDICKRYSIAAHFPLDAELELSRKDPREMGLAISAANEGLIRRSTMVFANLSPFRSPSVDTGTAFEIGFARGLGLMICGYSNSIEAFDVRTAKFTGVPPDAERDPQGFAIEHFGLVDNLMIDGAIAASGGRVVCVPSRDLSAFDAFERLVAEVAHQLVQ